MRTIDFSFTKIINGHSDFSFSDGTEHHASMYINYPNLKHNDSFIYSIAIDLINIASAISIADRFSHYSNDSDLLVSIRMNVKNLDVFFHLSSYLEELLYWYTDLRWNFKFSHHDEKDLHLSPDLPLFENNKFSVNLWSGGLDAAIGAIDKILATDHQIVLAAISTSNPNSGIQKLVYNELSKIFKNRCILNTTYIHVKDTLNIPKNPLQRTRGLVFKLIGSAYSLLYNERTLYLNENGYGAYNLSFRMSEIGIDHAKSAHPKSLFLVSHFVSNSIREKFSIINPYVFTTKSKMMKDIFSNEISSILDSTSSCDRALRDTNHQCGGCSSCILRRLSFFNVGFTESKAYYFDDPRSNSIEHFSAMKYQSEYLSKILSQENAWAEIRARNPTMINISAYLPNFHPEKFIKLMQSHVTEWNNYYSYILNNKEIMS